MKDGPDPNPWLDAIDADVPPLEEIAGRKGISLRDKMTAALLHAGRPLDLEELVAILSAAGVTAKSGNLALSIPRAWRGRPPVWRDEDGRFGIDVHSRELEWSLRALGVSVGPRLPTPLPPEPPTMPPDDVPLTAEEVRAAFEHHGAWNLSRSHRLGALLEILGRPLPVREAEDKLRIMGVGMPRTLAKVLRREFKGPVTVDDRDLLHLDPSHPGMLTLRRKVRQYAEKALIERQKQEHQEAVFRIHQEARVKRHRREQADALTLRRALVRALPERDPVLYGRLDAAEREIRTWPVDDVDGIAEDLAGYDVVVGLAPRAVLERTGIDPFPFALRDLSPPNKTRVINRRGRVLRITPELLITGTVRVSRPLADPKVVAKYVKEGHLGRLRRRLESDLKTLYAFYRYGTLHRAARLRWGFLDEWVPVEWAEEGDLTLRELLQSAVADGRELEVVTGHAPSFTDPWSRARRIRVMGPRRFGPAILLDVAKEEEVWAADVQAARLR